MSINEEIVKELERLGYNRDYDPDIIIKRRFSELPDWLQKELKEVGIKPYDA